MACVALQHDGVVHLDGGALRRNIARDELTRAAGWKVVLSTALDERRPDRLLERVAAAYERAADRRGPEVLPRHLRAG